MIKNTQSIKQKLVKMQVLTVVLVLSVCTFCFFINDISIIRRGVEHSLISTSRILGQNLESTLIFWDLKDASRILASLQSEPSFESAYLVDASGHFFAKYEKEQKQSLGDASFDPTLRGWKTKKSHISYYYPIVKNQGTLGVLCLTYDLWTVLDEFSNRTWITFFVFLSGLGITVLFANLAQRSLSKPIIELAATAKKIYTLGNYTLRANTQDLIHTYEEAATLTFEFNRMLETIQVNTQERAELLSKQRAAVESSRLKSEFLATMSHEVRTPLNGILGMSQLILDTSLTEPQTEFVQGIVRSGQALLLLINEILDVSKIEVGKLELEIGEVCLKDLLQDVGRIFSVLMAPTRVAWEMQFDSRLEGYFLGDSGRIRQIIMNLVNNAIKFTHQGSVSVRVFPLTEGPDFQVIRFEVQDTGIGISETILPKLFQPFVQADVSTTRKYGGTGLGLSIAKRLVELMGGEMLAKSVEGQGSLFGFNLRLLKASGPKIRLEDGKDTVVFDLEVTKNLNILVAEDNEINQVIIQTMVSRMGFQVEMAKTGLEVLEFLRRKKFDLVILDCHMPEMDGYTAAKKIRESKEFPSYIPIIALTANAMKEDEKKCLDAGMSDYLTKPISKKILMSTLKKWLPVLNK